MIDEAASKVAQLLEAKSIAIVGASVRPDAIGSIVLSNLARIGTDARVYPINPRYTEVGGRRCYPALNDLPEKPDAVFIAVPAEAAPAVLKEAGASGIRAAVVNASGFSDAGQRHLTEIAQHHGMALCGPNTVGLFNARERITLWTVGNFRFQPGPVAILAQSGTASMILAGSPRNLGSDYTVCCGNEAGLSVADYLAYAAKDAAIQVIVVFLETIRNPELFERASQVALDGGKRIIALKVGRTARGSDLVRSHTGALAGDDRIYAAYLRHLGIVTVGNLDELVETAILFRDCNSQSGTRAPLLATFSGGVAALAADLAEDAGLSLASLSPDTAHRIEEIAPGVRAVNPLDAWGRGWNEETFGGIVDELLSDGGVGAVVPLVDVPASGDGEFMQGEGIARIFAARRSRTDKALVLVNSSGQGSPSPQIESSIRGAGGTCLSGLEESIVALARWSSPPAPEALRELEPALIAKIELGLDRLTREAARGTDWHEFARDFGLRLVSSKQAPAVDDAVTAAREFGYPVVLKAIHPSIQHKTELGLVRFPLPDEASLSKAHAEVSATCRKLSLPGIAIQVEPWLPHEIELIVGVRNVERFGSFCLVGLGGIYTDTLDAVSVRLGPVTPATARRMLDETPAGRLLSGARGKVYDIDAVIDQIVALSAIGYAGKNALRSIEMNPLIPLDRGCGAVAVDLAADLIASQHERL